MKCSGTLRYVSGRHCVECKKKSKKLRNLKSLYDLSEEDHEALLVKQDFRCMICRVHRSKLKKGLVVDHDHDTGDVRGLLCSKCNVGIGMMNDNLETIKSAVLYLENSLVKTNESNCPY